MPYICLLLSGAALLINGLATLGQLPRRDAAVLSLMVGTVQVVLGVAVLSEDPTESGMLTAAGMFLFGLTYVYVGLDNLLGLGSKGLGWFCGMVAVVGLLLAASWLRGDPLLAVLWLCWSVLWALFFASMALGLQRVDHFVGWLLVLSSPVTATVPAFLGLAGLWPRDPLVAAAAGAFLAGLFAAAAILAARTSRSMQGRVVIPGRNTALEPPVSSLTFHDGAPVAAVAYCRNECLPDPPAGGPEGVP